MRILGLTYSKLFTILLLWLQGFPGMIGGRMVLRGGEFDSLFPKDYAENRKMWFFVIWNQLYFSLLMLLVDERYVVAKAIRHVCLRQLGSVPISGVKLFLPLWNFFHQKLLFSLSLSFSFLLVNKKSLAIFAHLLVAILLLILLMAWTQKLSLSFFLVQWLPLCSCLSSQRFLCSQLTVVPRKVYR